MSKLFAFVLTAFVLVTPAAQWTLLRWSAERLTVNVSALDAAHRARAPPLSP